MPASKNAIRAVWAAEDGRCDACHRALDRRVARVARVDAAQPSFAPDHRHVRCPDGKARGPDPLRQLQLADDLAALLAERLGTTMPAAADWLAAALAAVAVLVATFPGYRRSWLPGVGTFLVHGPADERPAIVQAALGTLAANPQVRHQPQARSRRLPTPQRLPVSALSALDAETVG